MLSCWGQGVFVFVFCFLSSNLIMTILGESLLQDLQIEFIQPQNLNISIITVCHVNAGKHCLHKHNKKNFHCMQFTLMNIILLILSNSNIYKCKQLNQDQVLLHPSCLMKAIFGLFNSHSNLNQIFILKIPFYTILFSLNMSFLLFLIIIELNV